MPSFIGELYCLDRSRDLEIYEGMSVHKEAVDTDLWVLRVVCLQAPVMQIRSSPDIQYVKRKLVTDLANTFFPKWAQIPKDTLQNLVEGFLERVEVVIAI